MSNAVIGSRCCCGPSSGTCQKDCIWQSEIESGCCHKADTLLFWASRPGYSNKTNVGCTSGFGPGIRYQEFCCTRFTEELPPVQAIYQFFDCYYRCQKVTDLQPLDTFGVSEMCPTDFCISENPGTCGQYDNCAFGTCCNDNTPGNLYTSNTLACCASCNDLGMSQWRKERMACPNNEQWNWMVEAICHKSGNALGSSVDCDTITSGASSWSNCDRLAAISSISPNQILCVVHFERWWQIANCPAGTRVYVPGCTQVPGGGDCGGIAFSTNQLVPKWWIFACSGIPLYAGDLIDAVRFGVITADERDDFLTKLFGTNTHPDQITLKKLADAGYIRSDDWRDEQRQAYIELDAMFPGAGYAACIQNVADMHTLGPFRKRMTYKTVGTSNQPLLRKADVTTSPDLASLQADCFINFPGGTQAQYDYWCQRQWVYFRGRPGGWTWVDWDANAVPGDEITSILLGDQRGSQDCIEAFKGNPRKPTTNVACSCCNSTNPEITIPVDCRGCDEYDCTGPGGGTPIPDCGPPDQCEVMAFKPFCEGLQIQWSVYKGETDLRTPDGTNCNPGGVYFQCGLCLKIRCLYQSYSYLVGAQRSVNSWDDSVPFTCRTEDPPLPPFTSWGNWNKSHPSPESAICSLAIDPSQDVYSWCWGCGCQLDGAPPCASSEYTSRMCCGGMCQDFLCDCNPCTVDPYSGPQASACPNSQACPPHDTAGQISCIGYTPDCP